VKKGYKAEYEVRKILFRKYSPRGIFKLAIGGAIDFCVLGRNGKVLKLIEVKKTNKKRWYPSQQELKQFKTLKAIQKRHKIPIEYWLKINGKWQIFNLKEVKTFFS